MCDPTSASTNATPPATRSQAIIDAWLAGLRASGYRLTDTRRALVEIMASSLLPLSAQQLFALAQATHVDLGLATVYRTLEKLDELGLVQRVHDRHGCHSYIASGALSPAAVVICQGCGRLAEVDATILERAIKHVQRQSNYQIQHYSLQLTGLCADCQA